MALHLYARDLPADHSLKGSVAIDTETMGLSLARDRLCLVQMSTGDGNAHMVQIEPGQNDAPNLKRLLEDENVEKIFHFARFDLAVLSGRLGIECRNVYCTKIASKLARTFTDKHGLKELAKDLIGVDLNKQQQSSDWGSARLSEEQLAYAAHDVLHLHKIQTILNAMLERENRTALAKECFAALPARVHLDMAGWENVDIFAH